MLYITAISLGFLGNFHCLGMCGPIALSLPIGKFAKWKKVAAILAYNLGRVITYGIIGVILGLFGVGINLIGTLQFLSILAGSLLIIFGIATLLGKSYFTLAANFKFVFFIKQRLGKLLNKKSIDSFLLLGFFNGMLPCGLVYAAAISSLVTGSVFGSSVYMIYFGIGTLPLMLAMPFIGQLISVRFRNLIKKVVPFSLIFFGALFILRGSNLGIKYLSPKLEKSNNTTENITHNTLICH